MKRELDAFADQPGRIQEDLRQQVFALLLDRSDIVVGDTATIFPFGSGETLDPAYTRRLGRLLVELGAFAVRDGSVDQRGSQVADLHRVVLERRIAIDQLFTFSYLLERSALDDLAVDETIGATTEAWPLVAQLIRRASFDVLAAYTQRAQLEPAETAMTDPLTTLHTRPLLDTVLAKEADRASRLGYLLSLILFDVDRLSAINEEHGYGVGDKVLERLGILIKGFFRQHDWIARYDEDSIAVLLTATDAAHAGELAERVRATVEDRLGFVDHRTDEAVRVTVSAAVVNARGTVGDSIDPVRLMAEAEAAVERAKRLGRNRVDHVDGYTGTPPAAST